MPEFYCSIVGWPVEAETAEDAAKTFHRMIQEAHMGGGMNPVYSVTEEEVQLWPLQRQPADGLFIEEFDSEEWYKEPYDGN